MAFAWRYIIGGAGKWGATVAVAIVLLATALRPLIVKIRRRKNRPRSGTLKILSDPDGAKFEIIAVHGLGADPEHTWTHAAPTTSVGRCQEPIVSEHGPAHNSRIHLLRDLLVPDFPEARVLSFEHNSNWLTDAPVKTSEEIGKSLRREINVKRSDLHLPIIFIGHSLGGIIIKHALCNQDSNEIVGDTAGIIFLGTPHQGSSVSVAGTLLAFMTGFLGSDRTLLSALQSHEGQLSNLNAKFQYRKVPSTDRPQRFRVISFYETKPTYLLGSLPIGLVVTRDSAVVHVDADDDHPVETDHSGLNKCGGRDELYGKLKDAVARLRTPSLLEQADTLIRNHHYKDKLNIVRLSGDVLPMDQCYINLAIIEHSDQGAGRSREDGTAHSPFTLWSRQNVETPDTTIQVELPRLFCQRERRSGGTIEPRRILIRGRAGVGKTTLCKKMVHDFTGPAQTDLHRSWTQLFDRLLWIPLRNLKGRHAPGYNYEDLFYHEYFWEKGDEDGRRLASALRRTMAGTASARTLFILDGLDEVSGEWSRDDHMSRFLKLLLGQPNVIITSRPNASLPADIPDLDLELETIGFYPDQVKAYLEADPKMKPKAEAVQSFLQKHWLIRGLVRIPILLDALCYSWEEFAGSETVPDTMTRIYQSIELRLWQKDIQRLRQKTEMACRTMNYKQVVVTMTDELRLLEALAFTGLHDDVLDFDFSRRKDTYERFGLPVTESSIEQLSFLRTSDPSDSDRSYHFLHLTFQEYFAARYFVRQWKNNKQLEYVLKGRKNDEANASDPADFLRRYKYSAHYDVFWRFVAGLLDAEGENETLGFFNAIETEPFDLLGPTHQRLVMHCLSEATELPNRSSLEARLSQWLLFECDLTGSSSLATESELPDRTLQDALTRNSGSGRVEILTALGRSGRHLSETTVAALAALLKDEVGDVRSRAAQTLGRQSNLPEGTLATLVALLKDEVGDVRSRAAEALRGQSNLPEGTLATLVALLKDEVGDVRSRAAEALRGQSNLPEGTLATLVALLKDEVGHVRSRAAQTLGRQSNLPQGTLAALLALLKDEAGDVRYSAAEAMGRQSNLPEETLVTLVALLKDEVGHVRYSAAEALRGQSNLPEGTLAALTALLKDEAGHVRSSAAQALRGQSNLPQGTLAALTALLKDEAADVRYRAAEASGRQSNLPEGTLAALTALLKDEVEDVRSRAAQALGRQSNLPEETLAALAALLKDEVGYVRSSAAKALGRQSNLPEETLAALAALLKDEVGYVRYSAAEALGRQSNLPEGTLATLLALLKDKAGYVRSSAAKALGRQSNLPEGTLAALAALLKDEVGDVRYNAAEALGRQSNLPEGTLATLVALLKDEAGHVRSRAAKVLGRQSNLPEGTLAALLALLKDEAEDVRSRVARTLSGQSNLFDRVLKAIGLLLESERQGETTRCTIRNPEFLESLYGSLLWRSFREQSSLYIDDDSCVINQATGLRTGSFENTWSKQFQDAVRRHRHRWSVPYRLWDSCKGEDHEAPTTPT